jgi:hypothetical protein
MSWQLIIDRARERRIIRPINPSKMNPGLRCGCHNRCLVLKEVGIKCRNKVHRILRILYLVNKKEELLLLLLRMMRSKKLRKD